MTPHTPSAFTLPNILTVVRILLTPFFIILLLRHQFLNALIVFTFAGISDALDGFFARYFNQRTTVGAYLDPIADKLLLMSSFITLAMLHLIPSWISVIVISRDILIVVGIGLFTITEKAYEINPSIISKFTTTIQIAMVIATLLYKSTLQFEGLMNLTIWVTAIFTVFSGLHYIYIGMCILQGTSDQRETIHKDN